MERRSALVWALPLVICVFAAFDVSAMPSTCVKSLRSILSSKATTHSQKFSELLKMAATESLVTADVLKFVVDSAEPFNPMLEDGHNRTRSFALRTGFDKLLSKSEDVDWSEVKVTARGLLEASGEREAKREKAKDETRVIPQGTFVNKFDEFKGHPFARPVLVEEDGKFFAVVATPQGLFTLTLPDLQIKSEFSMRNSNQIFEGVKVRAITTPEVFKENGRWMATYNVGKDFQEKLVIVDVFNPRNFRFLNTHVIPRADPVTYEWNGRRYLVYGSSASGLSVLNLTENAWGGVFFNEKNETGHSIHIFIEARPAVFFENGTPMALVNPVSNQDYTRAGMRLLNLDTRLVEKKFEKVFGGSTTPALYEKNGKTYAISGSKEKNVFIINVTDRIVEKDIPVDGYAPVSPVVFEYKGKKFATFGTGAPKYEILTLDLETNEFANRIDVDHVPSAPIMNPEVFYEGGNPYVVLRTTNGQIYVVDPVTGTLLVDTQGPPDAKSAPMIYQQDGSTYALWNTEQGAFLYKLFGGGAGGGAGGGRGPASLTQNCALNVALAADSAGQLSGTSTEKFLMFLKMAVHEKLIGNEVLEGIVSSSEHFNPMLEDGHNRTRSFALRTGFDKLLSKSEDVDWNEVKETAKTILRELGETSVHVDAARDATARIVMARVKRTSDAPVVDGSPAYFENNGMKFVVLGSNLGLYILNFPDFTVFDHITKLTEGGGTAFIMKTPKVFKEDGIWKAAVSVNTRDLVVANLDGSHKFKKLFVPGAPQEESVVFTDHNGHNKMVYGASTGGIVVVDLTADDAIIIGNDPRGPLRGSMSIHSRPSIFWENGHAMAAAVSTGGGLYIYDIQDRRIAGTVNEVGSGMSEPVLYRKNGETYAVVATNHDKTIYLVNVTKRSVAEKFPAGGEMKADPVVFHFEGKQYAAAGVTAENSFHVIDLETEKETVIPIGQDGMWTPPALFYGDGRPYLIQRMINGQVLVINPFEGPTGIKIPVADAGLAKPVIINDGPDAYAVFGSFEKSSLVQVFGAPDAP